MDVNLLTQVACQGIIVGDGIAWCVRADEQGIILGGVSSEELERWTVGDWGGPWSYCFLVIVRVQFIVEVDHAPLAGSQAYTQVWGSLIHGVVDGDSRVAGWVGRGLAGACCEQACGCARATSIQLSGACVGGCAILVVIGQALRALAGVSCHSDCLGMGEQDGEG